MYCGKCGTKLDEDAVFCPVCGKKAATNEEIGESGRKTADMEKKEESGLEEPVLKQNAENGAVESSELYVPDEGFAEMFLKCENASRLNRWRYFKRIFAVIIFSELWNRFAEMALYGKSVDLTKFADFVGIIISLVMVYVYYCLDVRRLKDLGKGDMLAKFRALCSLVAIRIVWTDGDLWEYASDITPSMMTLLGIIGLELILQFYLWLAPGNKGVNAYGPDPLGPIQGQA